MNKPLILAVILILGCTSATTQQAPPAKSSQFKNLQVFPQDISRDQLINTMKGFTRSLGVRCNHCHVVTATEPKEEFDFAADTKEEKRMARVMVRMVGDINGTWMERVEAAEGEEEDHVGAEEHDEEPKVGCWTCHRGRREPEAMPPPKPAQ